MHDQTDIGRLERRSLYVALALIGAAQGSLLYLIDRSLGLHTEAGMAGAAFAVAAGLVGLFAWTPGLWRRLAAAAIAVGGLYAALAWSAARSLGVAAAPHIGDLDNVPPHALTAVIGLAILVPAAQAFVRHGVARWGYEDLFIATSSTPLAVGVGGVMLGVSWALLGLWAFLFRIVGIEVVHTLITQRAFIFLFSCTMLGLGIAVARDNARVIAAIRTILLAGCRLLLPPMALFAVVFLLNLPVAGLDPLSRQASVAVVVLALAIATVALVNGVFQSGERAPAAWFRAVCYAAIGTVPFLAAIGAYAAGLRIGQHGLSDERFILAIVVVVVAAYGVSYAAAVALDIAAAVRGKPQWLRALPRINVAMAIAVVVIAALINTPVLDPVRWSVRDQVTRLESGSVSVASFDFGYLHFRSGPHGRAALNRLAGLTGHPEATAIREEIDAVRSARTYREWHRARRCQDRPLRHKGGCG